MAYFDNLKKELKEYFEILEPNPPEFLEEYIATAPMQRISKISMFCGKDYTASYGVQFPISNLDHSVGVALILWHFTHDKKITLAGLFHDIATPVFKHCIDYMNGDAEKQESIEEMTDEIISKSSEICALLERDGILVDEVVDYKIYPLADSETPRFSADRFEYNFSCGLSLFKVFELEDVRNFYNNIIVTKNEDNEDEFAFTDSSVCEAYIERLSRLWPVWRDERNNVYMQFLADICASASKVNIIKISDLYELGEREILDKILNGDDKYLASSLNKFLTHKNVFVSEKRKKGVYSVKMKSKVRYIVPLTKCDVGFARIDKVSLQAKKLIDEYLAKKFDNYGCLDFDFVAYK